MPVTGAPVMMRAVEDAGAVVEEDAAGAVVDEEAAPVTNGSQSKQHSSDDPTLGLVGGGGSGFGPGFCGMTTRFTRFTQRSWKPELAPWSRTW